MIYLMNSSVIPQNYEGSVTIKDATIADVKEMLAFQPGCWDALSDMGVCGCTKCTHNWLAHNVVSAVGHEATAKLMGIVLGREIKPSRVTVNATKGDVVVIFQLLERLPEGKILSEAELASMKYKFRIMLFGDRLRVAVEELIAQYEKKLAENAGHLHDYDEDCEWHDGVCYATKACIDHLKDICQK